MGSSKKLDLGCIPHYAAVEASEFLLSGPASLLSCCSHVSPPERLMRRSLSAAVLLFALAACQDVPVTSPSAADPGALQAVLSSSANERVMPGEVVIRVREGAEPAQLAQAHGLSVAAHGYKGAFVVMRGAVGNERAIAARLAADSRVVYAEPNYLRQPTATPVDSRLWAFYNPGGLTITYTRGGSSGQGNGVCTPGQASSTSPNHLSPWERVRREITRTGSPEPLRRRRSCSWLKLSKETTSRLTNQRLTLEPIFSGLCHTRRAD